MTSINLNIPYVSGTGGDDGAGSDQYNKSGGFSVYRTRGCIDINLNRLPIADDITISPTQDIVSLDAFVCTDAGTPMSGITGASTVNAGDYLVYLSGGATTPANWIAINMPDHTASLPNCPPRFVRVIAGRPDGVV
jgi:hypothetical protein